MENVGSENCWVRSIQRTKIINIKSCCKAFNSEHLKTRAVTAESKRHTSTTGRFVIPPLYPEAESATVPRLDILKVSEM